MRPLRPLRCAPLRQHHCTRGCHRPSRMAISALAAFIVLGAVAAAPAEAALPLPRSADQATAPAASEPGVASPKSPAAAASSASSRRASDAASHPRLP